MAEQRDALEEHIVRLRRDHILDAATKVFSQKGFPRATIRDIAAEAGIGDGTIYNYFDDKEALLLGILDRLNETEQRAEHFALAPDADLATLVVAYVRERMTLVGENAEVFQSVLPELLVHPDLRERYRREILAPTMRLAEQFFQAQIAQGRLRVADASLVTRALAGMVLGVLLIRLLGDKVMKERWADAPAVITDLLLGGLIGPEAQVETQEW